MTDEQRTDIIENLLDEVVHLHNAFMEVDEEENARCLYMEFAEWFDVEDEENGCYEVMWASNFSLLK